MRNRFAEMGCFVLAGGKSNIVEDFLSEGELTRLEKGYRRYAAIFESVKLVLKKDQAKERYLNYPHICDDEPGWGAVVGIRAALKHSESEVLFIGSSNITDFPLELAVELVRRYNGELFLGYRDRPGQTHHCQPLFGVFSRELAGRLARSGHTAFDLSRFLCQEGNLVPLPSSVSADRLGFR